MMLRDMGDADIEGTFADRLRSILPELDEADFERVDPPAALWERIEVAISSGEAPSPKEPPSRWSAGRTMVEYWIDANDVVIGVGQSWADFARDNDAGDLAALPTGCTLWDFFDSDQVRDLWRVLAQRVRSLQKEAELPLRCDAPDFRRWFDMTVTPEPDGRLHFRCSLVFEEARPPVSLLDPRSERDAGLQPVPLCGWCGRGQHGSGWLDIEELVRVERLLERESMPPISQGICGSCREEMSAELLVPGELSA